MSEANDEQARRNRVDEAEEMARLQEQINNLPVSEHIQFMMQSLSSLAIDRLGMVPDGEGRRDLGQARMAIDAFKCLLGVLEEGRPIQEIAAHRGVLSQLQLAYAGALGAPYPNAEPVQEDAAAQQPAEAGPTEGEAVADESAEGEALEEEPKKEPRPRSTAKRGGSTSAAKGGKATGASKDDTKSSKSTAAKGSARGRGKAAGGGEKSS